MNVSSRMIDLAMLPIARSAREAPSDLQMYSSMRHRDVLLYHKLKTLRRNVY